MTRIFELGGVAPPPNPLLGWETCHKSQSIPHASSLIERRNGGRMVTGTMVTGKKKFSVLICLTRISILCRFINFLSLSFLLKTKKINKQSYRGKLLGAASSAEIMRALSF